MSENNETPERKRERLRQGELKRNPSGNMNDALNRGGAGNLSDLAGSLGWKGIGIIILVIVIGFLLLSIFF
ncbi:DUF6366 family protein [Domibacillus enclensis]|uniref:Phage capsid protein n=1 Tax=Domibacillus enclensis TaxID=1017273 RepID=A0A1N6UZ60_9BACI|nr:DUF6366 family protein [Domibacillus enclensis]OXS78661.1 hypothetical protein B1B05_08695 [Domibacillus enclensis]SIQ70943.1 hypothetical protein SAMN05443094_103415 [Domibacillus enclensis]